MKLCAAGNFGMTCIGARTWLIASRGLDLYTSQKIVQVDAKVEKIRSDISDGFDLHSDFLNQIEDLSRVNMAFSGGSMSSMESINSSLSRIEAGIASMRAPDALKSSSQGYFEVGKSEFLLPRNGTSLYNDVYDYGWSEAQIGCSSEYYPPEKAEFPFSLNLQPEQPCTEKTSPRQHWYYASGPESDGLYHCPFIKTEACQHLPDKVKCNFE